MADIGSLRVSLGIDSVDFTQGMKSVNQRLRALDSEFKALTAGAGKFDNSLNALRARSDVLSRSMQTHRAKVEELRRKYEESARTKGEDATETQNLLIQYNRAITAMGRTENQLRSVNQRIQEQSDSFNQLSREVNSNVDRITREMRVLESGFDAATAGIRDFGNTTDQLQQRSQHLTSSLQLQERRVEELQRLYREAARSKGEDAQETQELLVRYNRATQAMRDTERQLRETNHEIEEQTSRWGRLRRSMRETEEHAQQMGGRMQSVGSDLAGSFGVAGAAIGAGLGFATKKTMDFEAQLSAVKAVSGATTGEMKQLKDLAIKYGADTKYSGLEAAQGIEELIKAGVSLKDIINGGLEGALSLATAGELELADAAEVASTALNAFKKDQLTVNKAADLLAGGANASATSVEELKYGLSQVSAVASGVGLSFKDTTTTLSVFAQNGLKGSDAGTSLKTMLMRLSPTTKEASEAFSQLGLSAYNTAAGYKYLVEKGITPAGRSVKDIEAGIMKLTKQEAGANATKSQLKKRYEENLKASGLMSSAFYDEKGQLKSMSEIAGLLQKSMKGLNDEQRQNYLNSMFGADAIRAGNILYKEGAKGVTDMYTAMSKVTAVEVANEKMNNLKGQIEELSGSFETAQISIGNALAPALSKVVGIAQKTVDAFNNLSPKMQATIAIGAAVTAGMLGLVAAVGVTLAVVGQAVIGFGAVAGAIGAAGGAAGILSGALAVLTGPIGVGVLALAGLGYTAYKVSKEMQKPAIEAEIMSDKISAGTQKAVGAYLKLDTDATNALNMMAWSQQTITQKMVDDLVSKYAELGERIIAKMQEKQAKQLEVTRNYFAQSSVLSDAEEAKIIEKLQASNDQQVTKVDQGQARIKEILTKAKTEKRALTEAERLEINKIQDQMRVTAVQTMSKGEVEQKAILERLKSEASAISATQAAQVVANSLKQKNETVKQANDQYKKSVAEIIRLRDEAKVISADQANKLIAEAKKQRDGTVEKAKDMHQNVVKEAKAQAGEHVNQVDWTTGQLKTKWQVMKDNTAAKAKEMKDAVVKYAKDQYKDFTKWVDDTVKAGLKKWTNFKDGVGKIWDDVTADMKKLKKDMLGYAEKIINGPIRGLNTVMKALGITDKKKQIDLWVPNYEKGTSGHPGGPALVNDAKGSNFKEIIQTPDGKLGMFEGRNVLADLPRGTKVLSGDKTNKVMKAQGIPHYKEGVGDIDWFSMISDPKKMLETAMGKMDLPKLASAPLEIGIGAGKKAMSTAVDYLKEKVASMFVGDGFTGGMEKDPGTVGPGSGMGGMMKYVEYWYNQVKDRFGKTRFMGGYNNRGVVGNEKVKSMHSYGRAFDIGGSHATMSKIAEYLRTAASNLQYVIYNRRIAGPGQGKPWRHYNGKNPHVDHVHADFKAAAGVGGIPGGKISGNLSSWINAAMAKAGVSGSNWLQGLAWIINKESSGNPKAVGAMTSTGTAKGLMQLKDFNYRGNPFDPVNNIFYGIKYIKGRYKSIEGALNWWRKHNWYANGTNFHKGGPAVVNDGKGPELIQFPTGQLGMFKGKNVLADLPRGTKVMPHEKTRELVNAGLLGKVPNYAAGVGDLAYIVKAGDTLSKIAKQFKTTVEELVKLNNIKDKNKIQVGQRIVYGKGSDSTLMTGQNSFNMGPVVPSKPPVDTRPQYAKDVTYLMGKAAKEEDAQLARMKKELNNKLVEFEKEKAAKIKAINEKAVKYNQQLLEKEKERDKKIKAINDKAAKSKRGLTAKEKEQIKKIRADYDKVVNSNKDLTKKQKDQIKKINDDYAKKERAAVNAHNKQISDIEKAAQQKRMQEIDAYVARKKEAGKLSLYDEIQVYRESMRHYKKNSDEWFAAEQKLNQAKVQMHNELKALKDDYLAKVKEVNQRVIDEEKRLNAEYEQELENRINNIKGSFGLFDEVAKPEEEIDPDSLIKKLHSQVYALNNWRTNLDALANRGIDKGLLEELQAMGPQALAEIKALNDMTDTQLNQFQGLWKDKTEAARLQATKELTDLKEKTLKQIELLHRDAEKELDELNKTFTEKVTELRTGAINEFQPFGAQLKDIGTNAIKGLMDGMTGMTGALEGKMKEISKLMVDTMKKALEIKSPSRLAKREIAGNYGLGLIGGLNEMKSPIKSKINEVSGLFNRVVPVPDIPTSAFASGAMAGGNSYDQSRNVTIEKIELNYSGSASEEDARAMLEYVKDGLMWEYKNNNIVNGVR